jgi:hypothetical protein
MNVGNLAVLAVLTALVLLLVQRTEPRRRWITALILIIPTGWLIYRWAIYKGQTAEALIALAAGVGFNVVFWLLYGRRHPPHTSDDIHVVGMEDE